MNHFSTGAKLRTLAVTMLAGVIAVSTTGCSNDLPTDAAGKLGPDAVQNQVAPPTNDDFDAATLIPALPFTDNIDTEGATPAPDDPDDCFGLGPTVWYQFTPTEDMRISANTVGSNYDTDLSVYTGTRGSLTQLACNDDAGFTLQSAVTLDVTAGQTLYFLVGAFLGGPGGNLVFNVDIAPPPLEASIAIARFSSVNSRTGVAIVRGTVTCSQPTNVGIDGSLRQRIGRVFVDAFFSAFVPCDGESVWEAEAVGQNGLFTGGQAQVNVSAQFASPTTGEFDFAEARATTRLRGAQ
jgi:hypothetical protein